MKNIGGLTAQQVRDWATAEVELIQARERVKVLAARCEDFHERWESKLAPSDDPKDATKDVKVARAGGWAIRFTRYTGGESFSLKRYAELGHKITAAMREAISPGQPQVKVTVKNLKGPTKPGAVEPA